MHEVILELYERINKRLVIQLRKKRKRKKKRDLLFFSLYFFFFNFTIRYVRSSNLPLDLQILIEKCYYFVRWWHMTWKRYERKDETFLEEGDWLLPLLFGWLGEGERCMVNWLLQYCFQQQEIELMQILVCVTILFPCFIDF